MKLNTTEVEPPPPAADAEDTSDAATASSPRLLDDLDPLKLLTIGVAGLLIAIAFVFADGGSSPDAGAALAASQTETTLRSVAPGELAMTESPTTLAPAQSSPQVPAELLDDEQRQMLRLYQAAFGREPDASGFAFWAGELRSGVPLADVAAIFASTDEFLVEIPANADESTVVRHIYRNGTGEDPDAITVAELVDVYRGGGMAGLIVAVSESPETIDATRTGNPGDEPS